MFARLLPLVPLLLASGCVSAVSSVVTAPFKVAGKAVDMVTTSQAEADRNRGRKLRKVEDRARRDCRRDGVEGHELDRCVRDKVRESGLI